MLRRSGTVAPMSDAAQLSNPGPKEASLSNTGFSVPKPVIDLQKRTIDFQKNVFDSGFEVYSRFQDQRRDLSGRMLEQVPNLPDEVRTLSDAWWQASISGREAYKSAIDRSFEILGSYYERAGDSS
jgi:hypothetical protein